MSDRELLELAAKAADYQVEFDKYGANCGWMQPDDEAWNPLEDDGDALRLAVKLNLPITPHTHGVGWIDAGYMKELCGADPMAATRRAIVRAAAAIAQASEAKV